MACTRLDPGTFPKSCILLAVLKINGHPHTISEIVLDKSRLGLIFKSPRASRDVQEAALRKAGAEWIVEVGKAPATWREAVRAVRAGDVVFIYALSMVPTKRGDDDLTPSAQVVDFLSEVHERGGHVVEVYTGRNSKDKAQRAAMKAEGVKAVRAGTRKLPKSGRSRGRPKNEYPADTLTKAREVWFSRDYATNVIAAKYLPKGITAKKAWELFGQSGRPYKKQRKR